MGGQQGWMEIPVPETHRLPRPVYLRAQSLGVRQMFPMHSHDWHQFAYATSGTLVVRLETSRHIITPQQAVWLPAGLPHASGALNGAEFRNLYIEASLPLSMPEHCTVLSVSPLLRALIIELERIGRESEDAGYIERVDTMILDQLQRLKPHGFSLPWPRSEILNRFCETLYGRPGDDRPMEQWARTFGASPRTLARRFEAETGLTLREWRTRLRLFRAIEWLDAGASITDIALDLGYTSSSAFAYMFRRQMRCSPSEWLQTRQP